MPNPATQLVSVVIPVFNGSRYVAEAIDSVLAQTWSAVEVIVVDDGSDDAGATQRTIAKYGAAVRLIAKPNGGVGSALNAGIAAMTGAWFSWLSHDDLYLPNKIERLMLALQGRPGPAIAFSDVELVDQHGQFIARAGLLDGLVDEPDPRWLVLEGRLNGCAMLIPRECLHAVGQFDTGLPTTQDYALWFELASRYPFVPVHEALVRSRIHGEQGSRHARHLEEASLLWIQMMDRMEESDVDAEDPVRSLKRLRRAQRFLRRSPYCGACAYLDERLRSLIGDLRIALVLFADRGSSPAHALQRLATAGVRYAEMLVIDGAQDAASGLRWEHTAWSFPSKTVRLPIQYAKPGSILTVALAHTRAEILLIVDATADVDDYALHDALLTIAAGEADVWFGAKGEELPSANVLQCALFARAAVAPTMAAGPQAFSMLGLRARLIVTNTRQAPNTSPTAPPAALPVLRSEVDGAISLAKMPCAARPTLLILVHAWGGGTFRYAELVASIVRDRLNLLFGWGVDNQRIQLSSRGPGIPEITYVLPDELSKIVRDLRALQVGRVDVMHSIGLDQHLTELLDGLGVPYDCTLLDYHQIALHPHLVDSEGCFVGDDAFRQKRHPLLRPRRSKVLAEAERVIACSRDLAGRVQRLTNQPCIAVRVPEPGNPDRFALHSTPLAMREWMRVLYLGAVAPHKGAALLAEVAALLRAHSTLVRIECLGLNYVEPPAEMLGNAHLRLWGQFEAGDLHDYICRIRPHLAWFPFTAPETYSFALSDAELHGLPILATGLGAIPERLAGRPATWVLRPEEATASGFAMWLDRLRRERLATPPRWLPVDHLPPLHEHFYPDQYLIPFKDQTVVP